jgi:hypothetical protein
MKTSTFTNLRAIFATVFLFALLTLSAGVITRQAKAFSVFTVTSTADGGPGSLRDAVGNASSGDTIMFSLTLPATITLTTGELAISKTLTIQGPGPQQTPPLLTISGNNASRIFNIGSSGNLTISGLTLANGAELGPGPAAGLGNTGGAIYSTGKLSATGCDFSSNKVTDAGGVMENKGGTASFDNCAFLTNNAFFGGAISNEFGSTLSLASCTFTSNSAIAGGAIANVGTLSVALTSFSLNTSSDGGAIMNAGAPKVNGGGLSVNGSTFFNNSTVLCPCTAHKNGGAVNNNGMASFANSTFYSNSALVDGGALYNEHLGLGSINPDSGILTLTNCTLSGNSAPSGGGFFGTGGVNTGTLNLDNTIIAHSTGGDCVNLGLTGTNSHNLIQDGSCSPFLSGDPVLGPLQGNGGTTLTMALLAGSPAIDAGDNSVRGAPLFLIADQRGVPRCHVDIGAYEFSEPIVPPPTVICPPNISVVSDPGSSSAMVSFAATATDFCDGQIPPTFKIGNTVITSPHLFPAGTSQVTIFATDLLHITGMCSFTVTVTALDTCIQDDHTGDTFRFSSQTGAYLYTRCKDKLTLSGTGSIKVINHIVSLMDSRPDRKVSAAFNLSQLTGSANVTLIIGPGMYESITLFQTNPHPTCMCP